MFDRIHDGRIKAVWIMATNPVVSLPDADKVKAALRSCEFVVVSDVMGNTDTAALAHVLLPALAWGEKDGTVTNSDRTISRQRAVPAAARRGACGLAHRLRRGARHGLRRLRLHFAARDLPRACAAHGACQRRQAHVEPRRLGRHHRRRIQELGARSLAHGADTRIGTRADVRRRKIPAPRRQGALHRADAALARTRATTQEFPLVLNTGRVRDHWHTMTRTGKSARLSAHVAEPYAEINTADALRFAVRDGELATLRSSWGSMVVRVRTGADVPSGMVFAPIHWNRAYASDARVGAVANPVVDPISGEPEFKHTPVADRALRGRLVWRDAARAAAAAARDAAGGRKCRASSSCAMSWPASIPRDWSIEARRLLGVSPAECRGRRRLDRISRSRRARVSRRLVRGRPAAGLHLHRPSSGAAGTCLARETVHVAEARSAACARACSPAAQSKAPTRVRWCVRVSAWAAIPSRPARASLAAAATAVEIGKRLKCGTNCGSCIPEIQAIIADVARPFRAQVGRGINMVLTVNGGS